MANETEPSSTSDSEVAFVETAEIEEPSARQPPPSQVPWEGSGGSLENTVASLIEYAIDMQASDLFFSATSDEVDITLRHLGEIRQITRLPIEFGQRCLGHIRAITGLRFAEKRKPQDGRWVYRHRGATIDIRLGSLPTLHGEILAMRLFRRDSGFRQLRSLGMTETQESSLLSLLHSPGGLILATGPTESGKSTTLYACLCHLNNGTRKIHTIEDPVEYIIPGVYQSQVDETNGIGFLELLRSVIRQSPDVIMIGEIRDRGTAETAVRAANSGQLVFATLHAPVAAAAVQSLLALGVAPHFLASSLLAVVGQRLVRRLNPKTRVPIDLSLAPEVFEDIKPLLRRGETPRAYAADASSRVDEAYLGQIGVFEIMTMNPELRQMVNEVRPPGVIARKAQESGMIDFFRAGLLKVARGETSFDELHRVMPSLTDWEWQDRTA